MANVRGKQVSATVPQEWYDTLEEHRWTARKTMTDLVKQAVEEYLQNHHLINKEPEAPAHEA